MIGALRLGLLVAALLPAPALAASLSDFFGSYVGIAEVYDADAGHVEKRDMDIVIAPYGSGGFRITWVNVSLVDGRRDVPGVQRRVEEVLFEPGAERGLFTAAAAGTPFREREALTPMRGDPVRWAALDGDRLVVHSFLVLDDGRYELQSYERRLTEHGLDIVFERIVDGEIRRRVTGGTVRAD